MKKLFYLAALITLFSCKENSTSSEKSTAGEAKASEVRGELKSVDDIKIEYAYISEKVESGSFDSSSFEYNCNDEKKGEVTYFSEEGQIRMIRHTYNEYSHFSATDEYFIKDEALFFVYSNHLVWNFVNENETRDDITEKRLYIIDNKPVKCLEKKFTIFSDSTDSPESSKVPNKEINCSSLESISQDFELLLQFRDQEEDLNCLEN